ncbi:hypothetical protein MBELCI_2034 [Limimaricola cinnabarinus LL-001]|uniref:Uncharacterized protein n=1 Tax=Limimaricola cinnabarinus LL-001 TaxID=1337093 RepID=U2Z4I8_9RHOB|nr:hypothetical protein MBELCI_2034 [Limimaricola cinnabarinus LL-001]
MVRCHARRGAVAEAQRPLIPSRGTWLRFQPHVSLRTFHYNW